MTETEKTTYEILTALDRMQPSVAPRRPRWRRHMPIVALALALAILVGAAARPARSSFLTASA